MGKCSFVKGMICFNMCLEGFWSSVKGCAGLVGGVDSKVVVSNLL